MSVLLAYFLKKLGGQMPTLPTQLNDPRCRTEVLIKSASVLSKHMFCLYVEQGYHYAWVRVVPWIIMKLGYDWKTKLRITISKTVSKLQIFPLYMTDFSTRPSFVELGSSNR